MCTMAYDVTLEIGTASTTIENDQYEGSSGCLQYTVDEKGSSIPTCSHCFIPL